MSWRVLAHRALSRSLRRIYRAVPVFGRLRGAVGIIADDSGYIVIERSDGFGLSFPGGLPWPWESEERAVRREVREETGLMPREIELLFTYDDDSIIPARITVFRVRAEGTLQDSWEGRVLRVPLEELRRRVASPEAAIVRYLLQRGY